MNYIRESEEVLKNHRKLNSSIINLKSRKNRIIAKGIPKDITGIDYSRPAIQKMDYSDSTMNEIFELMEVNRQIQETEDEMQLVENILKDIKQEDKELEKFLKLKYITEYKKSMAEIADILGYSKESRKTIYNIKDRALKEFAIRYFGVVALKYT